MAQLELGLQIPSEVEQALKDEAKKRDLLERFLNSGAMFMVAGTLGLMGLDSSGKLQNGWEYSVSFSREGNERRIHGKGPIVPEIYLSFTRDGETNFRNLVSITYGDTDEIKVDGNKREFPVMRNRPNRPNTRMENLRVRLGHKLRFDILDWYSGDEHLFVKGNLNSDLPQAISNAFQNPGGYNLNLFRSAKAA